MPRSLNAGDAVDVTSGPLRGAEGIVQEVYSSTVEIAFYNDFRNIERVTVKLCDIKPRDPEVAIIG